MKIGFTGTREGMTASQTAAVRTLLSSRMATITELHHGCCKGADGQFVDVIREILMPGTACECTPLDFECSGCRLCRELWDKLTPTPPEIIAHPPNNAKLVDQSSITQSHKVLPPRHYLERNNDIVAATEILLATPATATEITRSGSWMTIRTARQRRRRIVIVKPDGTVEGDFNVGA